MTSDLALAWVCVVGGCALSAAFTAVLLPHLRRANIRQHVREDGPESHLRKAGTPSMGGLAIYAAFLLVVALISVMRGGLDGRACAVVLFIIGMAVVGLLDDYQKLRRREAYGFGAGVRLLFEFILAGLLILYLTRYPPEPVVSGLTIASLDAASWAWRIFAALVLVGSANAVNLTDGLDGLAGGLTSLCGIGLAGACWMLGHPDLALLSLAVSGAAAGFLWFNAAPAKVFMGDVGSTGLGAALGGIAVAARIEVLLALVGLVFVAEALSVIAQVVSFRLTGRRVLRMAPLHHHLELSGWEETTIVLRLWIIGAGVTATGLLLAGALVR
ncbi:MAG: phospho-N-acetylmuramoyl-pentapeptide-transferase [Armatimonadota bacterium]|nr:phospho-N-acetylmuramoyl-pentapeptide-transferase [Armatimonadota bacterium]